VGLGRRYFPPHSPLLDAFDVSRLRRLRPLELGPPLDPLGPDQSYAAAFLPREAPMLARSWDRNSVCLSITRVLCDETMEFTADILIPHERIIILIF